MTQIEFEDPIRNMAEKILGFDIEEPKIKQGTGQIYTFNQLGFTGNNNRPDGWYLPDDKSQPAIILEVKVSANDMGKIIGKEGRVAKAIRTIIKAVAAKEEKRVTIEFIG